MAAIDDVRRAAHQRLRAQAAERVGRTVGFHAAPGGNVQSGHNVAQYQRAIGNTQQAVTDWEGHHPDAMARGNVPGWISNFLMGKMGQAHPGPMGSNVLSNALHGRPVPPPAMQGSPHAFGPGGVVTGAAQPSPFANIIAAAQRGEQNVAHHSEAGPGSDIFTHQLVPLGQGLFIHPGTGEIHGLGPVTHFPIQPMGGGAVGGGAPTPSFRAV